MDYVFLAVSGLIYLLHFMSLGFLLFDTFPHLIWNPAQQLFCLPLFRSPLVSFAEHFWFSFIAVHCSKTISKQRVFHDFRLRLSIWFIYLKASTIKISQMLNLGRTRTQPRSGRSLSLGGKSLFTFLCDIWNFVFSLYLHLNLDGYQSYIKHNLVRLK